ncbi:MAG: lactonase family protein [Dehalococcoidia bacterium]|nr:lactonase family protein [Dehalococcoidia bacterium]MDH4299715.1 lactonase family protein [Dehalococcoidia bacterium]
MSKGKKLIAYVGCNHVANFEGGGISVFEVSEDGSSLTLISSVKDKPKRAGYLTYAPKAKVLYSVDERKTDGRGPIKPASCVLSFKVDPESGQLTFLNSQRTVGAMPASVAVHEDKKLLFTANHAFFDHVVKAVETADGRWVEKFEYDDSTVVQYGLAEDGSIGDVQDVFVFTGHGIDPWAESPQGGGHAPASPHAHIVVVDPSGKYLVVCEKAAERVYVFRIGSRLELASVYQCPLGTGPRHAAFDKKGCMFMTCEFASELWSFDFDASSGALRFIDKQSTLSGFKGRNEPATLQIHPNGRFVYMNNRGEDTIVWFSISPDGHLKKAGKVSVSKSPDPKDATRAMTLSPSGAFLLVPDRPADVLRSYAVGPNDGSLKVLKEVPIQNPVFIQFVEL